MTLVVHMVGNAHLDPAWLWRWEAGVDEALNTCRTACDLLDLYPDVHMTRGEAWVHEQVQRLDPALFTRIAAHVSAGRWNVVNGYWVQPDCNLPGEESFRKQAEISGRYFEENLGTSTSVGYNVDSFGHCAMLPTFMKEAGMDAYVFSRPGPHEKTLPASLFRWRSPAGDEVTAFRIAGGYCTSAHDLSANIDGAIAEANRDAGHTMCFYGVGDHGGGPTRAQLEWIREHARYGDDVELRFSHPRAFFDAITAAIPSLPVVDGELQMHAIGCYSVVHDIKRLTRQAEALLVQAGRLAEAQGCREEIRARLDPAWKAVLFNEFHDIMGGTCIADACQHSIEELGLAKSIAREVLIELTRKAMVSLPPKRYQRLVVANPSGRRWRGLADFEPSLPQDGAPTGYRLVDEEGREVPTQPVTAESATDRTGRVLFPVDIPADSRAILELRRSADVPSYPSQVHLDGQTLSNDSVQATASSTGIASLTAGDRSLLGPDGISIAVFDDPTDTWSHGLESFEGRMLGTFVAATPWDVRWTGPLRATMSNRFTCEGSTLFWEISVEEGAPALRMRLRLHWIGEHRIVKLLIPAGFAVARRRDGSPGVLLERPLDGLEYPVRDVVALEGEGTCLAAMSPDVSSADVRPDGTLRMTLLRSAVYAHHDPFSLPDRHGFPVTDQGIHEYEIVLRAGAPGADAELMDETESLSNQLWISETTRGMPSGWRYDAPLFTGELPLAVAAPGALGAADVLARLEDAGGASLADGGTVCPSWAGEQVLVSDRPELRLKLDLPVDSRYRVVMAHAEGASWGAMALECGGTQLGAPGSSDEAPAAASGRISALPELFTASPGEAVLSLRRTAGERVGVGFVDCAPALRDIPCSSWMVAGPFPFGRPDAQSPFEVVEEALTTQIFAPERTRDFGAAIMLEDGSEVRWRQADGEGEGAYLDFKKLTGVDVGHLHYAATYVHASRPLRARLSYGIDYFVRMWLNGELIVPYRCGDGSPQKSQFSVDVDLAAGSNELLVKLASGTNGNGLWVALSDLDDLRCSASAESHGPADG